MEMKLGPNGTSENASGEESGRGTLTPAVFTFLPVVQTLPSKSRIEAEAVGGDADEETMWVGEVLTAERVFIRDPEDGEARSVFQPEENPEGPRLLDLVNLSQAKASPSATAQSENTPSYAAAASTGAMETAVDKHWGISQQRCRAEVRAGGFANGAGRSPVNCTDLFPTPASSRESVASLPSVTSPVSFSRTVSPCSSTRSGIFSPAVIQIKKHFLAPGSSLVHIPQTCFSSCDSLSSSVCPGSPPPRHRPPVTRLSLLTAILRKGRLPVLSPGLQRPYTPCWPVTPVTLSSCNACSAASSVASIPLEFSSQFSSTASLNAQREPMSRCLTAPPPVQRRWQQVISPPPRAPAPLFQLVPPLKHPGADSQTRQHSHVSPSENLNPSRAHRNLRNPPQEPPSPSRRTPTQQHSSAPQRPTSSLSKLRFLSQRLRSSPVSPPQLQPPQCRSPEVTVLPARADTASPVPPFQSPSLRSDGSRRDSDSAATPTPKLHCLSPSRYTHIAFPGWPSPSSSPTPTPSSAPPIRGLTPSPCTPPSPRPGSRGSDSSDREGKKRKTHRIKSSYKSFAAIPTNTLLLDQQVIDEQVERDGSPGHAVERGATPDTHAEMCSPAQLRQQSEELYAVIDEVLASSAPPTSRSPGSSAALQNNLSLSKSLGRETKYASIGSLNPSSPIDRKKAPGTMRPGIIRPMTTIPRLTVDEEFVVNPVRTFVLKKIITDYRTVEKPKEAEKDVYSCSNGQTPREERRPGRRSGFPSCDLYIGEPVKDASASFRPEERRTEAFETHI